MDFERVNAFKKRGKINEKRPHQRCCAAEEFECSKGDRNIDLSYYDFISEIGEVDYTFTLPEEVNRPKVTVTLVKVNWENSLQFDSISSFPFSN